MTANGYNKILIKELKDKAYRDAFVASQIDNGIAFQIRAMRKKENWTQKDLGDKADMKQTRIHILEDPNKINVNINTLRRIASAFDVALIVRFVPFSDLVKWDANLSSESLLVASYDEDPFFKKETQIAEAPPSAITKEYSGKSNVIQLDDRRKSRGEKPSALEEASLCKGNTDRLSARTAIQNYC